MFYNAWMWIWQLWSTVQYKLIKLYNRHHHGKQCQVAVTSRTIHKNIAYSILHPGEQHMYLNKWLRYLMLKMLIYHSFVHWFMQGRRRGWKDGRVHYVVNQYFATKFWGSHVKIPKVGRVRTRATRAAVRWLRLWIYGKYPWKMYQWNWWIAS